MGPVELLRRTEPKWFRSLHSSSPSCAIYTSNGPGCIGDGKGGDEGGDEDEQAGGGFGGGGGLLPSPLKHQGPEGGAGGLYC